jgi:hypothetical protein
MQRETIEHVTNPLVIQVAGDARLIFDAAVVPGPLGAAEPVPFPGLMVTAATKDGAFIQHLMSPRHLAELKQHIALVEKWLAESESKEWLASIGL